MVRRRYYRRKYARRNWAVERTNFRLRPPVPDEGLTANLMVVPSVPFEGVRVVKNLSITLCSHGTNIINNALPTPQNGTPWAVNDQVIYFYALVYIPHGYTPQDLQLADYSSQAPAGKVTDFYNANQFVISSGMIAITSSPRTVRSRLARKLNSGDAVAFVLRPIGEPDVVPSQYDIVGTVTYAITNS
jgi:hypothetical protein